MRILISVLIIFMIFSSLMVLSALYFLSLLFVKNVKRSFLDSGEIFSTYFFGLGRFFPKPVKTGGKIRCRCNGIQEDGAPVRFKMSGFMDCGSIFRTFGGVKECIFACAGGNSCVEACPESAIVISENMPKVLNLCTSCGICIPACPSKLLFDAAASTRYCPAHNIPEIEKICIESVSAVSV